MTIDPIPHSTVGGRVIQISGEIVRFALVGGAATLTHMGVAGLLIAAGPWPVWLVNLAAFAVAFWISFFGHRLFTFQRPGSPMKFLGAALAGLAVNNICLVTALWATGHDMFSIALAAIAAPAVVFLISRLWVFHEQA